MDGYARHVDYRFMAGGEEWAIVHDGKDRLWVEETRKNGQEDCHMSAELVLIEGRWQLEEDNLIAEYDGPRTAQAIEEHVNRYGPPPVE